MKSLPTDYYLSEDEDDHHEHNRGFSQSDQPQLDRLQVTAAPTENTVETETDSSYEPFPPYVSPNARQAAPAHPRGSTHAATSEDGSDSALDDKENKAQSVWSDTQLVRDDPHPIVADDVDVQGSDKGSSDSELSIDLHTPVWLRAEEAGMSPISPWKQTCDVSPSKLPPPAKQPRGTRRHVIQLKSKASPAGPGAAIDSQDNLLEQGHSGSELPEDTNASPTPSHRHRFPLGTLYERQPCSAAHEFCGEHSELTTEDVACSTDVISYVDVACQTAVDATVPVVDPALLTCAAVNTNPFPAWIPHDVVDSELLEGREHRLRAYVHRFRHSAVNAQATHHRALSVPHCTGGSAVSTPSSSIFNPRRPFNRLPAGSPQKPSPGRAGKHGRPQRATKTQAKDKITKFFETRGALDSQADSQLWFEQAYGVAAAAGAASISSSPQDRVTTTSNNVVPATPAPLLRSPATSSTATISPFSPNVADGHTPRRFTAEVAAVNMWKPGGDEFTYEELDWLTEFYLRTNALLTEEMITLHVRLARAERRAQALQSYIDQYM